MKNKLFILVFGTGVGQLVQFLCLPLITRFYSPEMLGSYGAILASATLLSVLIGMKMEVDYVKAPEVQRGDISRTFFTTSLIMAAAVLIIISSGAFDVLFFPDKLNVASEDYLWLVLLALALALFEYNAVLLSVKSKIKALAMTRALRGGGTGLLQAGFGFLGLNYIFVLIASDAFLRTVSSMHGFREVFRGKFDVDLVFVKQRLTLIGAAFLGKLSLNMPYILIGYVWGASYVGFYFITQRSLGAAMALLGKSVSNVYISEVSEDIAKKDYEIVHKKTKSIVMKSTFYSFPFFVSAGVFGYYFLDEIFGDQWSSFDVAWLCIVLLYFFRFSFSPISQTLNYIDRSNIQIVWEVFRIILISSILLSPDIVEIPFEYNLLMLSLFVGASYYLLYVLIQKSLSAKMLYKESK